jgi:hypothetical protein
VYKKEYMPGYIPPADDNFDVKFLEEEVIDSIVPANALQSGNPQDFDGFSYAVTEGSAPLDAEEMKTDAPADPIDTDVPMQSVDEQDLLMLTQKVNKPKVSEAASRITHTTARTTTGHKTPRS